ncbi:hypothetical protein DFH29DRAFT_969544 [Suillus ampliporus]|nr:hypothetical protein DFH29DRAFT_969544 [Suillus ampliporus]
MSQSQDPNLPDINWSIKLLNTILVYTSYALTEVNSWSTRHPYVAAGALICIVANPDILVMPLRLMEKSACYIFELISWPFKVFGRFILYMFGFGREGIAEDSYASYYQSYYYGGYVPRDSAFARFQSYGAADNYLYRLEAGLRVTDDYEDRDESSSKLAVVVSWVSWCGAVFVLGRTWGWWS